MRALFIVFVAALAAAGVQLWPEKGPVLSGPVFEKAAPGGAAAASESPVYTIIDINTYSVAGNSEDALLASMRANGPKSHGHDFFGLTETQMAYRYWKEMGEDGCRLEQIRIDLNVVITLPRWDAPRHSPYELRRDWTRFDQALRRHEDGHREIAEWSAREIYHALRNLRTSTCDTIDAAAQQTSLRLREIGERRQTSYDRQTGHGRTQNAVWPQGGRTVARR